MGDDAAIEELLAGMPEDRREALATVRRVVGEHLPDGFVEVLQGRMVSWVVPLERFPRTYNGQPLTLASLANQKRHMALYLVGVYADDPTRAWLEERWAAAGKKLDMGKSCLRFRSLDDLALDVLGDTIERLSVDDLIAAHERTHAGR